MNEELKNTIYVIIMHENQRMHKTKRGGKYSQQLNWTNQNNDILEYENIPKTVNLICEERVTKYDLDKGQAAATANCQAGKEDALTTGRRHDLVEQLAVRSLPDLLDHWPQLLVRLVDVSWLSAITNDEITTQLKPLDKLFN